MITITINDKEIKLEKPVTILEAARSAGIKIPTLCYLDGLEKFGGCRLCLVEVEKLPKLQTSCTVMVTDGMVVRTETEAIIKARRSILEFLLINHPLECPYCDKAGECELQDLVAQYGPETGRFAEGKREHPESFDDPIIVRNMERCVMCTRCVRMCANRQGAHAITVTGRGGHSFIEPFSGGKYNCEYCGNCLTVCPVGAIMSRLHRHSYRSWFVEKDVETVCGYCGVGCSLVLQMRENSILRTIPRIGLGVNKGLLCARGRFGYDVVESKKRLAAPMIRKDGQLQPVSWDEALRFVASNLEGVRNATGGKSIAGIASPRCTNEDNYVFQRFFRETLESNNIDTIARMFYVPAQSYLESIFGQGVTANLINGIENSDAVVVAGGDPSHVNPVLGLHIRAAGRTGARIITLNHADALKRFITDSLMPKTGSETILYRALLAALIEETGLPGRVPALEIALKQIKGPSDKEFSTETGLDSSIIKQTVAMLKEMKNVSFIVGPDVIAYDGLNGLFLVAGLIYMLDARVYLLGQRPNEQGVIDMGCLPDMLPGDRPLAIGSFREKFESEMGYSVPAEEGMTLFEMIDGMESGTIKAAYIMGDNPAFNLPSSQKVRTALSKLDFLVVQDVFMSETAQMAHAVLPAASWSEKDGTFVNLERRIQRLRKAKNSVSGMEDWMILVKLAKLMGSAMDFAAADQIWEEITKASHLYGSLALDELKTDKALWPYKGEPLRGTPAAITVPEAGEVHAAGTIRIYPERNMFHSGTLSRYSPALNNIHPEPYAIMGTATASAFSLTDGDKVRVRSSDGAIELRCKIDPAISDSNIRITNVFEGVCAMSLVDYTIEPHTKAAVFRLPEIKMEKVS